MGAFLKYCFAKNTSEYKFYLRNASAFRNVFATNRTTT